MALNKERLQQCLYLLWGERVDRGNKIYTDSWLWRNLSDSKDNHFPRTILQLLQYAVDLEKTAPEKEAFRSILRTQSLIDALSFASQQRVAEARDDDPELASLLTKLSGHCSPLSLEHLESACHQRLSADRPATAQSARSSQRIFTKALRHRRAYCKSR
jgi:hypothetical protein